MDLVLSLGTLAALAYFVVWRDWLQPALFGRPARSVKHNSAGPLPRLRSRRRTGANGANGGERRQNGVNLGANVPRNVHAPAQIAAQFESPAGAGDMLQLSQKELTQLAAAIAARANGATVDAAIVAGWGLKKGGGPAYRRAKALFDAATAAP
jgi:hypothetical protein